MLRSFLLIGILPCILATVVADHVVVKEHISTTTTVTVDCGCASTASPTSTTFRPHFTALPPATAYPVQPGLPEHSSPYACIPSNETVLYYGADDLSANVSIAELAYPVVNAQLIGAIDTVTCDKSSATVKFSSQEAYSAAVSSWKTPFTLITWHDTCGTGMLDGNHDYLLVSQVVKGNLDGLTLTCVITIIDLETMVGHGNDVTLTFSQGFNPNPAVPSPATCPGPQFDAMLDRQSDSMISSHSRDAKSLLRRIVLGFPSTQSPTTQSFDIHSDSAYDVSSDVNMDIHCYGCGANSTSMVLQGTVVVRIGNVVIRSQFQVNGPMSALLSIGVDADAPGTTSFSVNLGHMPISSTVFASSNSTSSISIDLVGSVAVNNPGHLIATSSYAWSDVDWEFDFLLPNNDKIGGLVPTVQPQVQVDNSIDAIIDAHLQITYYLNVGVSQTNVIQHGHVINTPGIQYAIGAQSLSTIHDACPQTLSARYLYNNASMFDDNGIELQRAWQGDRYPACPVISANTSSSALSSASVTSTSSSTISTSIAVSSSSTVSFTTSALPSTSGSSSVTSSSSTVSSTTAPISSMVSSSTASTSQTDYSSSSATSTTLSSSLVSTSSRVSSVIQSSLPSTSVSVSTVSASISPSVSSRSVPESASSSLASSAMASSSVALSLSSSASSGPLQSSTITSSSGLSRSLLSLPVAESVSSGPVQISSGTSSSAMSRALSSSSTLTSGSSGSAQSSTFLSSSGASRSSSASLTFTGSISSPLISSSSPASRSISSSLASASASNGSALSPLSSSSIASSRLKLSSSSLASSSTTTSGSVSSTVLSRSQVSSPTPSSSPAAWSSAIISSSRMSSGAVVASSSITRISSSIPSSPSISRGTTIASSVSSRSSSNVSASLSSTQTPSSSAKSPAKSLLSSTVLPNCSAQSKGGKSRKHSFALSSNKASGSTGVASSTVATVNSSTAAPVLSSLSSGKASSISNGSQSSIRSTTLSGSFQSGSRSVCPQRPSSKSLISKGTQSAPISSIVSSSAYSITSASQSSQSGLRSSNVPFLSSSTLTGPISASSVSVSAPGLASSSISIPFSSLSITVLRSTTKTAASSSPLSSNESSIEDSSSGSSTTCTRSSSRLSTSGHSSSTTTSQSVSSTSTTTSSKSTSPGLSPSGMPWPQPQPEKCFGLALSDNKHNLTWSHDGNIYIDSSGFDSHTRFTYSTPDHSDVLADIIGRILHGYTEELNQYGVSRVRLHRLDNMPRSTQALTLRTFNGVTEFSSPGHTNTGTYYPVVCTYKDCGYSKLFIAEDAVHGPATLGHLEILTGSAKLSCAYHSLEKVV